MPCNSDYLEPTKYEVEASKVLALLEELETGKLPSYYGVGTYHKVYSRNGEGILEEKVPELCTKLQAVEDVSKYSLELQLWWRDHQRADQERLKREMENKKDEAARAKAIAKLTPHERKLLNL